ncbi:DUF6314 family protein [Ruegeria sp. Ofav3-42]|uniref:DUF6314 family protein n=1 Tax=Ruegeria sp. Ofav3-42 TaxID=2917759 RepID=UPI001EF6DA4F|nr:DUF6314 family protein [Ruegeria sp. Ofav3-42]MCG7521313.1 DUF6314 family protein [Ruegeria sp. Ofav3-42]
MNLPTSLSDFEGCWDLTRTIRDARAAQIVQADGQANLHRVADGLIYDEEVTLHLPGQPGMKGTRKYLWRNSGQGVSVHFDDGRYFHTLKFGTARANDHHDCPPDSYDAEYDFFDWPRWSVRWIVNGPRKSYEMNTKYQIR